jgi:hypothetical protein
MLDGLSSWVKICCALRICVFILFAKAANCFVATWVPQVGTAKIAENMFLLLLLTHVEKLEIACGTAFAKEVEVLKRILVLFWIVWFRTEIPALNSATAKRKDGELLAAIHVAGS